MINQAPSSQMMYNQVGGPQVNPLKLIKDQFDRCEKALESGLPNEIDWSLRELCRVSCFADEQWFLGNFADGVEILLNLIVDYIEATISAKDANIYREIAIFAVCDSLNVKRLRACNAILVLSNFSSTKNNALFCAGTPAVRQTLILCRGLDSGSSLYTELIGLSGTALEHIAPFLHVSKLALGHDETQLAQLELHQQCLWQLHADALLCNDYRRIISAANILRMMSHAECHKERWLHAPLSLLKRFYELTLLPDGNIALAILELLLHLMGYGSQFFARFAAANPAPANFAASVSRHLKFQMNQIERDFWLYHWDYNDDLNPFSKPFLARHHRKESAQQAQPKICVPPIPDMFLDLIGLPYTAALVLKRLAMYASTSAWVKAIEPELLVYLANPRLYGVVKEILQHLS